MRKLSVAIAGALVLLLAGIFVWNAEATPLASTAVSMISMLEARGHIVLAQQTQTSPKATDAEATEGTCRITQDCLTINDVPDYCWDQGKPRGNTHRDESCRQTALSADEPLLTCYIIAGRRYCK